MEPQCGRSYYEEVIANKSLIYPCSATLGASPIFIPLSSFSIRFLMTPRMYVNCEMPKNMGDGATHGIR
jgi:hypothetical protein